MNKLKNILVMKRFLKLFLILMIMTVGSLNGQDFYHAAGMRLGKTDGFLYKHFVTENNALEVMLGFGGYDKGMQAYVLYEWHQNLPFEFTDNIHVYYGVGGHTGYISKYRERLYYRDSEQPSLFRGQVTYFTIGADAIVGLEYRIFQVPMTVGLDIKPYFEYYGFTDVQFKFWDFALNVKYIF